MTQGRQRQFCSQKCSYQWISENLRGSEHPNWQGAKIEYACRFCKQTFTDYPSAHRQFCSRDCYSSWRKQQPKSKQHNWKGGKKTAVCSTCGKELYVWPYRIKKAQAVFCSYKCRSSWYSENYSGEHSPQWLNGQSFEPYPPEFNRRRKREIRERDKVCQLCGNLRARCIHHINYCKDDNCDKNLILLCRPCHTKTNHRRSYWQALLEAKVTHIYSEPVEARHLTS